MDVIVIGSGAAGLAAMRRLYEAGLIAICLEAANRIGGRVNTVPFADGVVDLGAAVCEGENNNIMYEMVKSLDLLGPITGKEQCLLSNGDLVADDIVKGFSKTVDQFINYSKKDGQGTVSEAVKEFVKNTTFSQEPVPKEWLLEYYERQNELGGNADGKLAKSLKGFDERWVCDGDIRSWKGKGSGMILDVLMGKYPDPSKALPIDVQMEKEVDNIIWKNPNKMVKVVCKDGSSYEAKSVISTISVGVLKEKHTSLFTPELPAEKVNAFTNLCMFIVDKIFMEFTTPWWPKDTNFQLIWRPEDKDLFSDEEKWVTGVYKLGVVENQPRVIMGWINDETARAMEATPEEKVKETIDKMLNLVFGKKFNLTPMKSLLRTKWFTNRWERGVYSYRSALSEQYGAHAQLLEVPVYNEDHPAICFAGEATSEHYSGTVHGAIETGIREADRLIKEYKR